jgi:hypothetical protein
MELVRFIYCQIFQLAGYATGRVVLTTFPAAGFVCNGPWQAWTDTFTWHGFRRDPDGIPAASAETAELIGVLGRVRHCRRPRLRPAMSARHSLGNSNPISR